MAPPLPENYRGSSASRKIPSFFKNLELIYAPSQKHWTGHCAQPRVHIPTMSFQLVMIFGEQLTKLLTEKLLLRLRTKQIFQN